MSEWYYSKDGAQLGPVSEAELGNLLAAGTLDAQTVLIWKSGMADWIPAAQVPEFAQPAAAGTPYAAPASGFSYQEDRIPLPEIEPGSESIDAMACFKRGFDLAVRHIGPVLIMMVVYIAVSIALNVALGAMDKVLGWGTPPQEIDLGNGQTMTFGPGASIVNTVISYIVSVFLSLGIARFALNMVSGREAGFAQLFGETPLLLRGIGASLLFAIMVGIGMLLLIVPGVYLISRYGLYIYAIVDKKCGVIESFQYSSRITTNNRMNMVLVMLISLAAVVLGCLALCVGLLFAYPVILLAWTVAYRWLQYGHRAAMDHPGTTTPMLTPTQG